MSDNAVSQYSKFLFLVVESPGVGLKVSNRRTLREMSKRLGRKKYRVYKEVTGSMVTEVPTLLQ